MPEGDTVWRTARSLEAALAGADVVADLRVPSLAEVSLSGRVTTLARGKHLLTRFDGGCTLHTHLRMEGSWHLYRPGEAWRRPAHQARAVLASPEWTAVGFSLGVVEVVATAEEHTVVGHLGPDLLGDWDPVEALRRLRSDPSRPLHPALLDQRNLAGVGNLYATELCFLAGVAPTRPVEAVPDLERVVDRAHRLLRANAERAQQTTTGDLRAGRQTWVYDRDRRPCRRCGTRITSVRLGPTGQERLAAWCTRCQPG
ncbi:putative endonuclease 8 2 [Marmoricola endophyticus]|uniref:DNA-(apurinic or apyrimidinic site) lyase n=1 Tax=Marmoricola endophyticus TaxID=2040280 RepID=A0A917BUT7_9ACTN|nr:DNA-formamidopyrimidine glycosylase family protein [Marmoricola endophyticus]GGF55235.1 putative endonuclease 8 2 [Marmoricola endophyticus]